MRDSHNRTEINVRLLDSEWFYVSQVIGISMSNMKRPKLNTFDMVVVRRNISSWITNIVHVLKLIAKYDTVVKVVFRWFDDFHAHPHWLPKRRLHTHEPAQLRCRTPENLSSPEWVRFAWWATVILDTDIAMHHNRTADVQIRHRHSPRAHGIWRQKPSSVSEGTVPSFSYTTNSRTDPRHSSNWQTDLRGLGHSRPFPYRWRSVSVQVPPMHKHDG